MWWMSAATLPVPISPLPQQSPELCFLLPPKLVLWGILTHFPRKGTGQSGNSPALPINRGCSPGHWEWLGNEHVTQLMPMKCQMNCWGGTSGKDTFSVFSRATGRDASFFLGRGMGNNKPRDSYSPFASEGTSLRLN